jgi:hypothetical protein
MTETEMAARFDRLSEAIAGMRSDMDRRFERIDTRLEHLEKTAVTKADLFQSVIVAQGVFYAGALAMVVVLNAVGAFG